MTGIERLVAAARGGEVDRQPVILWGHWDDRADACAVPTEQIPSERQAGALALVRSPLKRALDEGFDLNGALASDPARGNEELDRRVQQAHDEADQALASGADGIAYWIDGAYPAVSTPMQYGGYHLERDRELLETVKEARFNLAWIDGTEEVYLDSVSDLPADALGWRMTATNQSLHDLRPMRQGLLSGDQPDADVLVVFHPDALAAALQDAARPEVHA